MCHIGSKLYSYKETGYINVMTKLLLETLNMFFVKLKIVKCIYQMGRIDIFVKHTNIYKYALKLLKYSKKDVVLLLFLIKDYFCFWKNVLI